MIKIAFFDIDGTILKMGSKQPSANTIYTLNKLKEKGALLCMATGRSYPVIPYFENIEFDILLTFNGSYVVNEDEVIYNNPFNNDDKNIIIQNLKNMNRAIAISNKKEVVTNGIDDDLQQYFDFGHVKVNIADNFDEICKEDIYQIMCSCTLNEYDKILQNTTNVKIAAWWDRACDIIPASCGKGIAIEKILNYYGFSKEEAIAFGDGKNDIEMLQAVGTGVAMGNAKDEVKAFADDVCKSVEEDGIYYYCLEKGLI